MKLIMFFLKAEIVMVSVAAVLFVGCGKATSTDGSAANATQAEALRKEIASLKTKLANCRIVDKSKMPKGVIAFGALVTVKDLSDGMEEQYELVGPGEEDYDGDVMKILTSSPIAQAMLGKKVGDKFETEVPVGMLSFEITEISDSEE